MSCAILHASMRFVQSFPNEIVFQFWDSFVCVCACATNKMIFTQIIIEKQKQQIHRILKIKSGNTLALMLF